ncbi:cobalamin biosynthesis protein CobW [Acetobacter conturbans]|uniref:Cobalamin biosynthesis protein CobW n=1 Tax=Acetobacter conturbans TaxID=1737472 RepID=A0ABX0K6Q7_9PROT|nr:cobalamin biosynthesis protein CobW [Acetobacter conturbans]NHN89617.1 cobalamin biosynthesis protein CobW [Acetobacter conturbans]
MRPLAAQGKIAATIITGFLGAGKTTLLRHLLEQVDGRRIAVIVNEFGSLGIDGDTLRACGIAGCRDEDIVELANGCLCCTVADDFLPTIERLLDRPEPPEHIVIETSGLALPKPLLKAFNWPTIRPRLTVDGVITVVDAPAVVDGRFADDPEAVAAQRAADPSLDHDNPLAEVFEDQLLSADLVVLNKTDLLDEKQLAAVEAMIAGETRGQARILQADHGRLDPRILLGLGAAAEDDLDTRPSHHDGADDHEHDDFESFVLDLPEYDSVDECVSRLTHAAREHDILRMKGFAAIKGKNRRLGVQAVGARVRHEFDPVHGGSGRLVIIGQQRLNRAAIAAALGAP